MDVASSSQQPIQASQQCQTRIAQLSIAISQLQPQSSIALANVTVKLSSVEQELGAAVEKQSRLQQLHQTQLHQGHLSHQQQLQQMHTQP